MCIRDRVRDIMILLKDATICASPIASTTTFLFLDPFAIILYYLVTIFLLATVFLLPFLVLELFFVFCPLRGKPILCLIPL